MLPIGPESYLVEGLADQAVLFDDALPNRLHNPHMFGEIDGLHRTQFHVEIVCELWPKRGPAERIAIGNIKILVCAFRVGRHPSCGFGQVQGLGALIEGLLVPLRAGEAQRQTQFPADSRIGADQADHAACNAGGRIA